MNYTKIVSQYEIRKPKKKYPKYKMPSLLLYDRPAWRYLEELEDSLIAVSESNYLELRKKCKAIYKGFGLAINWQKLTLDPNSTFNLLSSSEIAPPEILDYYLSIEQKYHALYTDIGKWHKENSKNIC
jgi:hypothetical protein